MTLTAEHKRHISEGQKRRHARIRQGRCTHLHSGATLDLRSPDPSVITLDDVSFALAHTCRFPGQAPRWHSVAEHSIIVAQHLREQGESADKVLAGLLHDASEMGLSDIPTPVKSLIRGHRRIEGKLDEAILKALGLPADLPLHDPVVKAADRHVLAVEVTCLLKAKWDGVPEYVGPRIKLGMAAKAADKAFKREYRRCIKDLT